MNINSTHLSLAALLAVTLTASAQPRITRQPADPTFTKITAGPVVNTASGAWGFSWVDYDDDGHLDLFLVNFRSGPNSLFRNLGDGSFTRVTEGSIVGENAPSTAAAWADYDNDGDFDVFIPNWDALQPFFYRNDGNGVFTRITQGHPVQQRRNSGGGAAWADYDRDGHVDLLVSHNDGYSLYRNNGDGSFTKVTTGSLINDLATSHGCAWGDYDNDGFLDLAVANGGHNTTERHFLYRNNGNDNHWMMLKLIGAVSNRGAIGAKVRLHATIGGQDFWQRRDVFAPSGGYGGSQNDPRVHFGLGDAIAAETIRIEWPSGIVQELHNVAANRILTVVEPPKLEPSVTFTNGLVELKVKSWKGFVYDIEASGDLKSWTRLTTLTNETAALAVPDPVASRAAQRFYRVVSK